MGKRSMDYARDRQMKALQVLCNAIMIRRSKTATIDGRPILADLPVRNVLVDQRTFSNDEREFYDSVEKGAKARFNKLLAQDNVGRNMVNLLVLLLRMRQACCHPYLIKDLGVAATAEISFEQMRDLARQLRPNVVQRIKDIAIDAAQSGSGDVAFECPVCLDSFPNPAIYVPCGHLSCSDCFAQILNGVEGGETTCPNCREKIKKDHAIDFVTFKQIHQPELLTQEEIRDRDDLEADDSDDSDSEDDSEDEDDDDTSSLDGFIVNDDDGSETEQKPKVSKKHKKRKDKAMAKDVKGKGTMKHLTLGQLAAESKKNASARERYRRRLRKNWVSSTKIDRTMELLKEIQDNDSTEKTIIFSLWTSLLDLVEVPLMRAKYQYRRYDGSMTPDDRVKAVSDFMSKPGVNIMLVSLKAGNAGLNLNKASQVIILDPFWNPYVEEQAIDRAHRIGQTRPVQVHRILIPNSVEDRIMTLQEQKRELISTALDEGAGKTLSGLSVQQLRFLFVSHPASTHTAPDTDMSRIRNCFLLPTNLFAGFKIAPSQKKEETEETGGRHADVRVDECPLQKSPHTNTLHMIRRLSRLLRQRGCHKTCHASAQLSASTSQAKLPTCWHSVPGHLWAHRIVGAFPTFRRPWRPSFSF